MKTIWRPKKEYWVGAKGKCTYCGTQFELEKDDFVVPIEFGYGQLDTAYMHHFIKLKAWCPTCSQFAELTQAID